MLLFKIEGYFVTLISIRRKICRQDVELGSRVLLGGLEPSLDGRKSRKGRSNKNLQGRTELLSLFFKMLAMINR